MTYIYGHLPIFIHDVRDTRTFRMFISQLYLNGSVRQSEICQTFGVKPIFVKRSVKLHREKGTGGFYEERPVRGPVVLTPPVLEKAQQLFDYGLDLSEVAETTCCPILDSPEPIVLQSSFNLLCDMFCGFKKCFNSRFFFKIPDKNIKIIFTE